MKSKSCFIVLLLVTWSAPLSAGPYLASGGGQLVGLSLDGIVYDIHFSDGVVGDVFREVVFDDEYSALANAITVAVTDVLNDFATFPIPPSINGCEMRAICYLYNPDWYIPNGDRYVDQDAVGGLLNPDRWERGFNLTLDGKTDTSQFGGLTILTFSEVPIPASVYLVILGIAGVFCFRRGLRKMAKKSERIIAAGSFWLS